MAADNRQDCTEFAAIAFWDLTETDVYKCSRFFVVPNPQKRVIKDVRGTLVYQVLFESSETHDIFFFWKGKSASDMNLSQASFKGN